MPPQPTPPEVPEEEIREEIRKSLGGSVPQLPREEWGKNIRVAVLDTWPMGDSSPRPFGDGDGGPLGRIRHLRDELAHQVTPAWATPALQRLDDAANERIVKAANFHNFVDGALEQLLCGRRREGTMEPPYNLCDHGLFVADIVNHIAPGAELVVYRVLNNYGAGDLPTVANAMEHAITQARNDGKKLVINLSLGFAPELRFLEEFLATPAFTLTRGSLWAGHVAYAIQQGTRDPETELHALGRPELDALRRIFAMGDLDGVLVVAAAGNDSARTPDITTTQGVVGPRVPAAFESILGVSSVVEKLEQKGGGAVFRFAPYSNDDDFAGTRDDGIAAFGGDIDTKTGVTTDGVIGLYVSPAFPSGAVNTSGWARWSGTSFATPFISGLAACVWAEHEVAGQALTAQTLLERIVQPGGVERKAVFWVRR